MGASQSKSDSDEQVFRTEVPIQVSTTPSVVCTLVTDQRLTHGQFSEDVVNDLIDHATSPSPSPERQSNIDAQIRERIQSELQRLRTEEEHVREEIERALEKENLDKERALAGEESAEGAESEAGRVRSSAALMGDLEELRQKVERFQTRRALNEFPEVQAKSAAVVNCYKCVVIVMYAVEVLTSHRRSHPTSSLDCWREVTEFKNSVAKVEQVSSI